MLSVQVGATGSVVGMETAALKLLVAPVTATVAWEWVAMDVATVVAEVVDITEVEAVAPHLEAAGRVM